MARILKDIRVWEHGRRLVIGDAETWEDVAIAVDLWLDKRGYDPVWHMDLTTRVETADTFDVTLTTDD
jgi:hypothetical protein